MRVKGSGSWRAIKSFPIGRLKKLLSGDRSHSWRKTQDTGRVKTRESHMHTLTAYNCEADWRVTEQNEPYRVLTVPTTVCHGSKAARRTGPAQVTAQSGGLLLGYLHSVCTSDECQGMPPVHWGRMLLWTHSKDRPQPHGNTQSAAHQQQPTS